MIKFFKDEPTASFGFIGANSISENREETKRFNIYKKVMENFFSPVHFAHHNYNKESAYILLNRKTSENSLSIIEELFTKYYDFE